MNWTAQQYKQEKYGTAGNDFQSFADQLSEILIIKYFEQTISDKKQLVYIDILH